jgi:hypothetical protein
VHSSLWGAMVVFGQTQTGLRTHPRGHSVDLGGRGRTGQTASGRGGEMLMDCFISSTQSNGHIILKSCFLDLSGVPCFTGVRGLSVLAVGYVDALPRGYIFLKAIFGSLDC